MEIKYNQEIMGKLIQIKLNSNKLYLGDEFKKQIYNGVKKGLYNGFIHNDKMYIVGERRTNLLTNLK